MRSLLGIFVGYFLLVTVYDAVTWVPSFFLWTSTIPVQLAHPIEINAKTEPEWAVLRDRLNQDVLKRADGFWKATGYATHQLDPSTLLSSAKETSATRPIVLMARWDLETHSAADLLLLSKKLRAEHLRGRIEYVLYAEASNREALRSRYAHPEGAVFLEIGRPSVFPAENAKKVFQPLYRRATREVFEPLGLIASTGSRGLARAATTVIQAYSNAPILACAWSDCPKQVGWLPLFSEPNYVSLWVGPLNVATPTAAFEIEKVQSLLKLVQSISADINQG